ncbi:DUF4920 domain-containing protein [Mucilaginibacter sp. HD30]
MKVVVFIIAMLFSCNAYAQQTPLPHGMVFGQRPDTTIIVASTKAMDLMGKKIRINTTLRGRVINVTKQKGGWFKLDAGDGKVISAHFKNYNVTLPMALKGRIVIIEGVAVKLVDSTNGQRFGGNTAVDKDIVYKGKPLALTFEVSGLMVYK